MEQSLVEHVGRGEQLDLTADDEAVDEAAMRSWGDSRTCRASVIRDILRGRLATDPDPHGLRLRGAKITGRLDLENLITDVNLELTECLLEEGVVARDARLASVSLTRCQLEHSAKSPLDASRLTCSVLSLDMTRVIAHATVFELIGSGAVDLRGAHIAGDFSCIQADLRSDNGTALNADGLQVGQDMLLSLWFTATGSGRGAVSLIGAHIGGVLHCSTAKLHNDSGTALLAAGLQVDQNINLHNGFAATGSGPDGAVHLGGARIGGDLDCSRANLRNDSGPALAADGLQVGRAMLLRGLAATGSGGSGAVRLTAARIGLNFECARANLRNDSGPALAADALQVGQNMYLTEGFAATGSGEAGAVRLIVAHIGGQLGCMGAKLRNDSGAALEAQMLQVGQNLHFSEGFTATGGGARVAVNLTNARVGAGFRFAPAHLEHMVDSHRRLSVDGLTYAGVPKGGSAQEWRDLLRHATPEYAAQPYQQLAASYRALGDEQQARQTLMAQRDDELARTHPRRRELWWGWITKVTLGYGYQPWRALLFLAAVMAVSCVLAVVLGAHGALAQTSKTATPGRSCTVVQQLSVGLDLNLPTGTTVARAACDLTSDAGSVTAAWLSVTGWVLRILAWAFVLVVLRLLHHRAVRKT